MAADDTRRNTLSWAANEGGWQTHCCGDAQSAIKRAERFLIQLAIVDLEGTTGGRAHGFDELLHRLAERNGLLLVICGHQHDPQEEVDARRLGAWLYLPGANIDGRFSTLCSEAREIAQQLAANGTASGRAISRR